MKTLVVGCSYAKGHGLKLESRDPLLWVNRLLGGCSITNLSSTGKNNHWIFLETVSALLTQRYDLVLVCWSAIPRYHVHVGLETWPVDSMLKNSTDINLHGNITVSADWLDRLGHDLNKIHNDHWDLLDLVKYVNTLIQIQHSRDSQIYFVNSLGPWSCGYFGRKNFDAPSQLSLYEQDLLDVDHRSDEQVRDLYHMIHTQYDHYGGIQEPYWLNLYQSLKSMQIDTVSVNDLHPGYRSQEKFVLQLEPVLKSKVK